MEVQPYTSKETPMVMYLNVHAGEFFFEMFTLISYKMLSIIKKNIIIFRP